MRRDLTKLTTECEQVYNAITELEAGYVTAYDIAEVTDLPTVTCEQCLSLLQLYGELRLVGALSRSMCDRRYTLKEINSVGIK